MKPMVKYRGGKSKEIELLTPYFPKEYKTYFEPFLGGGAVFFHLNPQKAVINDINEKLMAFYDNVKNDYPRLRSELDSLENEYSQNQKAYKALKAKHPNDRVPNKNEDLYYSIRKEYNYPSGKYLPGTLYYFINKTAYSGMIRFNSNGEYNVPFGRYINFNTHLITEDHHELLKRTTVLNEDYETVFKMASKDDFMFLDPPYDCVFNDYGNIDHAGGFSDDDQIRLATAFKKLKCKALMVVAKTPIIEKLYGEMIVGHYNKMYAVNIRNRFKNGAEHVIIVNYSEDKK